MRRLLCAAILLGAAAMLAAEGANLVRNPGFADGKEWWCSAAGSFAAESEGESRVVRIKGLKDYVRIIQTDLAGGTLAGKTAVISFRAKAARLSGNVIFEIREIDAAGKSVTYDAVKVTEHDQGGWESYRKSFRIRPATVSLNFHIEANWLDPGDDFVYSDLKVTLE